MRLFITQKFNPVLIDKDYYPFFERIFYRKISKLLTPYIAKIRLSPTVINIIGFLIGCLGLLLIALGPYWFRIAGGLILIFSYILDCVDGELARGYKMADNFGALLDTTLDSVKESLIMFALGYSFYQQTHNPAIGIYIVIILFVQRMFGRTLPWYRMLYEEDVNKIEKDSLKAMPMILRPIAIFFSEAYRSGTIWIVILLGIITDQILPTFIYFIIVIFSLFLFLIFNSYKHHKMSI